MRTGVCAALCVAAWSASAAGSPAGATPSSATATSAPVSPTDATAADASPASQAATSAGETPYVSPGAELSWTVARAPLATEQLGVIAAAESDRVRSAAEGRMPLPQVLVEGVPPVGATSTWAGTSLKGATRGRAPLGARWLDGRCRCATEIGDQAHERIAALYAQVEFTAGDEVDDARVLHLRLRYSDGVIAWLNGREIARRGIRRERGPMMPVDRPAGPEWESFYVPLARGLLKRGQNRLSLEVRPHRQERAPLLDVALSARSGAHIVRGPAVQWLGDTAAAIAFDTDLPAHGKVELTAPPSSSAREVASAGGALAEHHRVVLTGLPPASAIRYRAIAGGDVTDEFVFRTPPAPGDVVRFGVYGDMRGGHRVHARIVESLIEEAPDFVVVTGDLVLRGTDEGAWQTFFQVTAPLVSRLPLLPAIGNHDVGESGDEARRVGDIFTLPAVSPARPPWGHWYSFDVAGLHFVMLDSNMYGDGAQLDWLRADLAAARKAGSRAIFAVTHDGPYSRGSHGGSVIAREVYAPLLVANRVLMLFSGHDHLYQRGEFGGLRYIVSGGGGAPLYAARCGARGRPRCEVPDGASLVASEYHYVMVTVQRDYFQVCPKRPDRTPLEKCVRFRLPPR